MFSISTPELRNKPDIGKKIECLKCGKRHLVIESVPPGLSAYRCKGKTYLCGIRGKAIR